MSDTTTTTITPEERQSWRDMFEMVKKNPSQHGMIITQNGMPMERLLNALEQAEANAARLRDALQTAESALSLAHHRGQYDLVDKALSKVCTALYGNKGVDIEAARRAVADTESEVK